MNKDNDEIKGIVSELVEGKKIDWDLSKQSNPEKSGLLNQFEAIDKITQAFGILINDEPGEKIDNTNILFEWGHLQVLEKIGEGSYGEVYRAYDSVLDRNVALKLLKKEKSSGFHSREFMQEAKRLAQVRNRHVLAVHGASIYDLRVGIWSDLIIGTNLSETESANKKYSSKDIIHLASSLADALTAVHSAGLVHGDIKPSNVMQDTSGKIILMDFGAGIENSSEYSQSGYVVATPLLMSPELFQDEKITPASDIYALGVLLFKLATDKYPIEAQSLSDIQMAHKNKKYLKLQSIRSDLPKPLINLIQDMMSYDSKSRPSAIEIQDKISWIKDTPKRRNKQISISLIFVLLLLGILISTNAYYRVNQEKQKSVAVNDFMLQMLNSTARLGKGREARVAEILDYAASNVDEKFANQPHTRATILNLLGNSYINLQLPEDALKQLTQGLAIRKTIMSKSDPDYLGTLYLIAFSHQKLSHFLESKKLYTNLIEIAQKDEVENFQLIQLSEIRLAQILSEEGKLEESEKQLLKITKNISIENDSNGDNGYLSLYALANNYILQSKYKQAEQTARKSLDWLNKHSKNFEDNKNNLNLLIASTLSNQGRFKEAVELYRQALKDSERLYGQENRAYLATLVNLAGVLQQSGQLNEALEFQIKSLEISKKTQGQSSNDSIIMGINLANTKVSLGDLEGGEILMRETLSDATKYLGDSNIETLKLEYNLAELLNNTKRFIEAEKLATSNNSKMEAKLGKTHLFTLLSNDNIAMSLAGQKKYSQSNTIHQQTLINIEETMGKNNPYYLMVLTHYVDTLVESNSMIKAKETLLNLINLQIKTLGENHKDTLKSIDLLNSL